MVVIGLAFGSVAVRDRDGLMGAGWGDCLTVFFQNPIIIAVFFVFSFDLYGFANAIFNEEFGIRSPHVNQNTIIGHLMAIRHPSVRIMHLYMILHLLSMFFLLIIR